ncbi:type II secretion system protein GspC [Kineobactrum salinum]|uniref:Type II secretion system protein GspC n=1 Tax=Kineobactrum salinum TaxID=2708301 RepID=A0A6C0U2M5_9GAMM|nr:type II secretion system protein GspC [Kineobactrum salinum]QIB66410.1 type II secretion system protein GspC [Kineobactrum salinum]
MGAAAAGPAGSPARDIINPPARGGAAQESRAEVDIEALRSWQLFGDPGAAPAEAEVAALEAVAPSDRDGIEKGARETRLNLTLRGIIAYTADGLGSAIIEHQSRQGVYAVDDALPVPGNVVLAKVMPGQVVLDNGGNYELLSLYRESELDGQLQQSARRAAPTAGAARQVDVRADPDTTELASGYRQQLYQNPQSLAELVRISPVREDGQLRGYRLAPGQDQTQFQRLGFRAGDVVVAVNGLSLSDPANTMRLYQAMRTATEAEFELQRDGQPLAVRVSLGDAAADQ